jgi:serine/threonine protein kinase
MRPCGCATARLTGRTPFHHPGVALFTIESQFRYDIVRKIFEGGMGVVYEAEQHGAQNFIKRVAMKVIRQHYASQRQFIENFIGEAKLVADLIHTNIVQTYHLGKPTACISSPWN